MASFINPKAFIPFPEMETPRLILTRQDLRYVDELYALRTNPLVMRYIDQPFPASREVIEAKIKDVITDMETEKGLVWAMLKKDDLTYIGNVAYWKIDPVNAVGEIGYSLHPDYWGQGYMQEAIKPLLPFAFHTMGLHRIEANVNKENQASMNLLKRMGFRQEAHFRENYAFNGQFLDSIIFGLLEKDLKGDLV